MWFTEQTGNQLGRVNADGSISEFPVPTDAALPVGIAPGPDGSLRLDGPLTQTDLASMVGCTRQSVNKLLGLFVGDGLVALDRDAIVILDLDGLLQASHR